MKAYLIILTYLLVGTLAFSQSKPKKSSQLKKISDTLTRTYFNYEKNKVLYIEERQKNLKKYYSNNQDTLNKAKGFYLNIKSNVDIFEDTLSPDIYNIESTIKRKSKIIEYVNNGIGTEIIIDSVGDIISISNFIVGIEKKIYYTLVFNRKGMIQCVYENNMDSSLCQITNSEIKYDTLFYEEPIDSFYRNPDKIIKNGKEFSFIVRKYRMKVNGKDIIYDHNGLPYESNDIINNEVKNLKGKNY